MAAAAAAYVAPAGMDGLDPDTAQNWIADHLTATEQQMKEIREGAAPVIRVRQPVVWRRRPVVATSYAMERVHLGFGNVREPGLYASMPSRREPRFVTGRITTATEPTAATEQTAANARRAVA